MATIIASADFHRLEHSPFISISDNQLTYGLGTYIKKGFGS